MSSKSTNLVPRSYRVPVTEIKDPYNHLAVEGLGSGFETIRVLVIDSTVRLFGINL